MYRNYTRQYVGFQPVPFTLPIWTLPRLRLAIIENGRIDGRSIIVIGAFLVVLSSLGLAGLAFSGQPRPIAVLVAVPLGLTFGIVAIVVGLAIRSTRIAVFHDGGTGTIAVADHWQDDWDIWLAAQVPECRLVLNPVVVQREMIAPWNGFMLTLEVGTEFSIVAACLESRELLDEWRVAAPAWVAGLPVCEGGPVRRRGSTHVGRRRT
jgi:hypothetical protein